MNYTQYIKPALLALVPFLIGFGEVVKRWLFSEKEPGGKIRRLMLRIIKTTKHVPYLIWLAAFILSAAYGFIASAFTGWRLVIDAIVFTGLIQGSIASFAAMGIFDTLRKKG